MEQMGGFQEAPRGTPSEYSDDMYPPPPMSRASGIDDERSESGFGVERRGSRRFSIVDGRGKKMEVNWSNIIQYSNMLFTT